MVDHIVIWKRLLAGTLFFITSSFQAVSSFAEWKCRAGSSYFYSEFDPVSWKIESELNYEEVYKNFEYFEVTFDKGCEEISVKKYIKGELLSAEKYRLNVDGSLSKTDSN